MGSNPSRCFRFYLKEDFWLLRIKKSMIPFSKKKKVLVYLTNDSVSFLIMPAASFTTWVQNGSINTSVTTNTCETVKTSDTSNTFDTFNTSDIFITSDTSNTSDTFNTSSGGFPYCLDLRVQTHFLVRRPQQLFPCFVTNVWVKTILAAFSGSFLFVNTDTFRHFGELSPRQTEFSHPEIPPCVNERASSIRGC